MKWRTGLVVLCIFVLMLVLLPAAAVFEVPEDAVTFESLGLSETYDGDTTKYQTKEVTMQFAEPNKIQFVLYTFRSGDFFDVRIYLNGLLVTADDIYGGNQETTLTIPGAYIEMGENTIYLEFIDRNEDHKFSTRPLTIAPKSYILPINEPDSSPTSTPTPTPTPTPTQTESPGFTIIDIQKSSETSPEINIEPIDKQKQSNSTVLLSGSASSDSGIKSVTVNGQYAGTENWIAPIDFSGDGNIVIIATGNDGNTTIQNIGPKSPSSESEFIVIIVAIIAAIGTIIAAKITINKKKEKKKIKKQSFNSELTSKGKTDQNIEDRIETSPHSKNNQKKT